MAEREIGETPQPKEPASYTPLVGMQARFVLADTAYLDPDKKTCPDEALSQTKSFAQRDYEVFDLASVADRKQHWAGNVGDFAAKYNTWEEKTLTALNSARETSIIQKMTSLFDSLNIHPQNSAFTKEDIHKIWNRYFENSPEHKAGGVRQFVSDVLDANKTDGIVDQQKLASSMKSIQWFSRLFGDTSREIVTQLINAEARLMHDPTFAQSAKDQTNNLTPKEEELLTFLTTHVKPISQRDHETGDQEETREQGELPILKHTKEIKEKIESDDCVIIVGDTGCGKTIGVPPMIRELMKPGDKLIVTEPRQINTSELAITVARNAGVTLGQEIGYQHGGDSKFSDKTDTLFTTEGTLILKLLDDPLLSDTTHVMIDEVHVRSTDTEQLLRYLKEAQRLRKEKGMKPLKIIAASATVDKKELADYLNVPEERIVNVAGERRFSITPRFATRDIPSNQMPQAAADAVASINQSGDEGDIIIFVAGTGDIESTATALQAKNLANTRIIKLHANSDESEKEESMKPPTPGTRRVIIATNFAETGLTIKGLKYVINTGEEYERTVDPVSGLEYIRRIPQAKAGCIQREGRVGRRSPGVVINLFTKANYNARSEYPPMPEIQRTDLTDLVLKMKKRGIQNFADFQVLSSPLDERRMAFANETLQKLGATNPDGSLTRIGKRMIDLPIDIRLARMIAEAERNNRGIEQMCTITALVDARALFLRDGINGLKAQQTRQQFRNQNSDYLTYLAIWEEFERNGESEVWAADHGLNFQKLMQVKASRDRLISRSQGRRNIAVTNEELEQYVVAGLKDRIMEYNPTRRSYVWGRNNVVNLNLQIGNQSALYRTAPQYIVAQDNTELRGGTNPIYVTNCQRVKPEWLAA